VRFGLVVNNGVGCQQLRLVYSPAAAETKVKLGSDKGMLVFDPPKLSIKPGDTVQWVNNKVPPTMLSSMQQKTPTRAQI